MARRDTMGLLGYVRLIAMATALVAVALACGPGQEPTPTPTAPQPVPTATFTPTVAQPGLVASPTATPTRIATPTPTVTPPPAISTPTPSVKRGGVLTVTIHSDSTGTLDPVKETNGRQFAFIAPMFSNLIRYDPLDTTKLVPDLAKSWKFVAPNKYVFQLRDDAKFIDGTPVTAEDVLISLRRHVGELGAKQQNGRVGEDLKRFWGGASISAPNEITVANNPPSPMFLNILGSAFLRVMSKKQIEALPADNPVIMANPIGSGPFKLKQWKRDALIEMERHPDYVTSYAEGADLPYLNGIIAYIIPDANAQLAALQAGQIDVGVRFGGLTPSQAKLVKDFLKEKVVIEQKPDLGLIKLAGINVTRAPLNDPRVVKALWVAMDRPKLQEVVYEGLIVPGAILDPGVFPGAALSLEELAQYPGLLKPDYDLAKKLLADAGYPKGLEIPEALTRDLADYLNAAQVIIAGWEKAGITFKAHTIGTALSVTARTNAGDYYVQTSPLRYGYNVPDMLQAFTQFFTLTSPAAAPVFGIKDTVLDGMVNKAVTTLDAADRIKQIRDIQKYVLSNMTFHTPIVGPGQILLAKRSYVKNHVWGLTLFEGHSYETVWLDK